MAKTPRTARTRHEDGKTHIDFLGKDGEVAVTSTIEHSKINKDISGALMGYGAVQVAQNKYSAEDTPAAKKAAADAVIKAIYAGEWEPGSRESTALTPSIILAIAEVTGKPIEDVETKYDTMAKGGKMKLAKDARIVIARKRIDAERTKTRLASLKKVVPSTPLAF